jgi:TRAP-type C4-dicarboxylate transport system permease small subunit
MTCTPEHHPAAVYYATPDGTVPEQPKDLTALGAVAFATAAVATLGTCAAALVLGRATRIRIEQGHDAVDWSLGVYYAATVLAVIALVAGFVTGSMWLYRARKNAELLDPERHHARGAGWAWGGWVTPVVALWFPFQVVRDVRRAVAPLPSAALIAFWWTLFLATEIGWRTSLNLQGDALNRFGDPATAHAASVITAAVMVAALAGWGEVLRAITVEQHQAMYAGRPG